MDALDTRTMQGLIGRTLGRYRVVEKIGGGGVGADLNRHIASVGAG
jgi:hypothetical protein